MCFSVERPIITRLAAGPALSLMMEAMEKGRRGLRSVCVSEGECVRFCEIVCERERERERACV